MNINLRRSRAAETAKVKWMLLLWILGVPLPLILLFVLLRGCSS